MSRQQRSPFRKEGGPAQRPFVQRSDRLVRWSENAQVVQWAISGFLLLILAGLLILVIKWLAIIAFWAVLLCLPPFLIALPFIRAHNHRKYGNPPRRATFHPGQLPTITSVLPSEPENPTWRGYDTDFLDTVLRHPDDSDRY